MYLTDKSKRVLEQEEKFIDEDLDDEELVSLLILLYLVSNGIIPRKVLRDLLSDEYNIDFDYNKLDELVGKCNGYIYNKDYYTIIDSEDKEMLDLLIKAKERFGKYKVIDFDINIDEEELFDKLSKYLTYDLKFDDEFCEDLFFVILYLLKHGLFNDISFKALLKNEEIELKDEVFDRVVEIVNKYKDNVSVWNFNGYSINEVNEFKNK